jgi:hypothetical protein
MRVQIPIEERIVLLMVMAPRNVVGGYRRFGGTRCPIRCQIRKPQIEFIASEAFALVTSLVAFESAGTVAGNAQ